MDALLSLPILSVLFLPSVTSWSTSLNVLFFYLTWSTLLLSHAAWKVEFLGTLFIRLIFYLIPSYAFLFFDLAVPSLAVNIKKHGELAIATSDEHGDRKGRWAWVALVSTLNVILGVVVQTGIDLLFTNVLHIRSALKITTTLPMPWGIIKDVARGFLFRELFSYFLHRYGLHAKRSPLRSVHSSWYHTLPSTYPLTAHYDHPLAYLVHVFLPTYLPALIFRFHLLTFHAFLALVSIEELFVQSGYSHMPTGFILGGIARRQERHLMGGGKGNFGAYGLTDLLAGTNIGRDVIDDVGDEVNASDVPRKVSRKAKQIVGEGGGGSGSGRGSRSRGGTGGEKVSSTSSRRRLRNRDRDQTDDDSYS